MFLFKGYNNLLNKSPLFTKSLTGGFIFSLADIIAQNIEIFDSKKNDIKKQFNIRRTLIATTMGTVFMTPLFHYWFTYVLPGFVKKIPFTKNAHPFVNVLAAMSIDQTIWACGITAYYFIIINLLEHQSLDKGISTIKNNIKETMISNWKIWPAAQILNFWLIPIQYQVLWVNMVGLFWQIYLVGVQHRQQH